MFCGMDIHLSTVMLYKHTRLKRGESQMVVEVKAWDDVTPHTWDEKTPKDECGRKINDRVLPLFQTTESTNELSRSCGYISFTARHGSREERFSWGC